MHPYSASNRSHTESLDRTATELATSDGARFADIPTDALTCSNCGTGPCRIAPFDDLRAHGICSSTWDEKTWN